MATITALWLIRCLLGGTLRFYGFVVANTFLAFIPLLVEPVFGLIYANMSDWKAKICNFMAAAIWLLFLPNAFYILTDFMHLNGRVLVNARSDSHNFAIQYSRGDGLYTFDSLMLLTATVIGAYAGGLALVHAFILFKKHTSLVKAHLVIGATMLLAGIGVYIGRFGRWNSWEGLTHPVNIICDLVNTVSASATRERFLLVILTIFLLQCMSFWIVSQRELRP